MLKKLKISLQLRKEKKQLVDIRKEAVKELENLAKQLEKI